MRKRKLLLSGILLTGIVLSVIIFCNRKVEQAAIGKIYTSTKAIPYNHVGLLLGTGKYLGNGAINPYYSYRIDAALKLLIANKISFLVISGDNSRKEYNEPEMMKNDLVDSGIDSSRIFLDYAGFRTFDSMVRLREIFSQNKVTIISQPFHNKRALYIGQREGINAVGFNAKDVDATAGLRTQLREKLARVKVFADYLFHTQPKFLGPKVAIPLASID